MISTFWFLIKAGFFVAAFMALISMGGHVSINFENYAMQSTLGLFLIVLVVLFYGLSIGFRTVRFIAGTPKNIASYNEKKAHKKGLQSLAYGLSAVAAGDVRMAQYYSKRASKFLTQDFGLSDFLNGLTARLSGDEKGAVKSFQTLGDHKETSFLGLKGLMNTAMDKGDMRYARVLAEKSYAENPKQLWVLKALYDLNCREELFEDALLILPKLKKLDDCDYRDDEAILNLVIGDAVRAYKLNPQSLPVGLAYLKDLTEIRKRRKSVSVIKKLWRICPHPKLVDYWIKHAQKKTTDNRQAMVAWIEDLYHENTDDASSALYIGEAILRLDQKEQASRFLRGAIQLKPTIRTYQLMHKIDPLGGWMENLITASQDKAWICACSGKIMVDWTALGSDGHFNTIVWDYPDAKRKQMTQKNPQSIL
jgi:HemY protein